MLESSLKTAYPKDDIANSPGARWYYIKLFFAFLGSAAVLVISAILILGALGYIIRMFFSGS